MFIVPITPMTLTTEIAKTSGIENSKPTTSTSGSLPFSQVFQQAIDNVKETQAIADQDAYNLAMGNTDDLHTVMINSAKAVTALELTTQLTSKAVNAYNEIMRMQI